MKDTFGEILQRFHQQLSDSAIKTYGKGDDCVIPRKDLADMLDFVSRASMAAGWNVGRLILKDSSMTDKQRIRVLMDLFFRHQRLRKEHRDLWDATNSLHELLREEKSRRTKVEHDLGKQKKLKGFVPRKDIPRAAFEIALAKTPLRGGKINLEAIAKRVGLRDGTTVKSYLTLYGLEGK